MHTNTHDTHNEATEQDYAEQQRLREEEWRLRREEQEKRSYVHRNARHFERTPLVSPAASSWSNVPGHLLLRSDPGRLPDLESFEQVVWAGVVRPLPPLPPELPGDDYCFTPEQTAALFAWWDSVLEWRRACDPEAMKRSWLLAGLPGQGKTRAAIARAQVWSLYRGVSDVFFSLHSDATTEIPFVRAVDFIEAANAEAHGKPCKIPNVSSIRALGRVGLLILDDFDTGVWTNDALAALYGVIDERLHNLAPTIVTANGSGKIWLDRIGGQKNGDVVLADKILSRMKRLCGKAVRFGEKPSTQAEDAI